jgi:hypothetical protein
MSTDLSISGWASWSTRWVTSAGMVSWSWLRTTELWQATGLLPGTLYPLTIRPPAGWIHPRRGARSDGQEVDREFPSAFAFVVDVEQFPHQGLSQGFRCAFSDAPA